MDRTIPQNSSPPSPMPTSQTYISLQMAFAFLNARFFNCSLPHVLITLQKKNGAGGFFAGSSYSTRDGSEIIDVIALNPTYFAEQNDAELLAIIGHEMCHLWQHRFGTPPTRGGHDEQFAKKMISIGLIPSQSGAPNGRKTGRKMSHYIEPGGLFDVACRELLATTTVVTYVERIDAARQTLGLKKRASKSTFVCPGCKWQIWGKPDTRVRCDGCNELLVARAKP